MTMFIILLLYLGNQEKIYYYELLSNYLNNNNFDPEIDIYIGSFRENTLDNSIVIIFYQMKDGVIIKDSYYTAIINENKIEEFPTCLKNIGLINIDKDNILTIGEIKSISNELISDNLKKIGSKKIEGTIQLHYENSKLCFYVSFNNGSYISIDAKDGSIIKEFYFNGIMT